MSSTQKFHIVMSWSLFILLAISPSISQSKVFENSYIKFELPNNWSCQLLNKAYLCRHRISKTCLSNPKNKACQKQLKQSKEAVIVMSAKPKSAIDSLDAYSKHFGQSKKISKSGRHSQSKVIHSKNVSIKGQKWVDAMQLSSELPNYYTRYLATIKKDIAVLISFTSHKKNYTNYNSHFFNGIKSLEVTTTSPERIKKAELAPQLLSRPIDIPLETFENLPAEQSEDSSSNTLFLLAMILVAIGLYLWVKNKKNN